jgi:hypothetical protein
MEGALTSSGKAIVGEILALFYGSRGKRVFYLVPSTVWSLSGDTLRCNLHFLMNFPSGGRSCPPNSV